MIHSFVFSCVYLCPYVLCNGHRVAMQFRALSGTVFVAVCFVNIYMNK